MSETKHTNLVRSEFIEKVGLITQAEGLPRIAGRVFGLLVFDGAAVSFGDLAEKLEVSRASISTSVRLLEERGLVKRIAKSGKRQDFFQLAPNPYATMLLISQKRMCSTRDEILQTINGLPQSSEARSRLTDYAAFYDAINAGLGMALDELQATPRDLTINRDANQDEINEK